MKLRTAVIGCLGVIIGMANAGQPQPPVVIYGQVRDEYGYPLDSGAEVSMLDLSNGSNVCGSYTLDGDIYVGVNYRISVPLEDVMPLLNPHATIRGRNGKMVVRINGVDQPLVPAGEFTVPTPGTALQMDFSIAEDKDGDGLPDAWEELMIAWSEGMFSSIYDIDPNADPDGDGMTNLEEYLAGTFPFSATDVFEVTRSEVDVISGRIALTFTTKTVRKYHILIKGKLSEGNWLTAASSSTPDGELEYRIIEGTGRTITVYVDGSYDSAFFRVGAN